MKASYFCSSQKLPLPQQSNLTSIHLNRCAHTLRDISLHNAALSRAFSSSSSPSPDSSTPSSSSSSSSSSFFRRRTLRDSAAILFFLATSIFTFYLGVWQWRRRQWKIDLISARTSQLSKPSLSSTQFLEEVSSHSTELNASAKIGEAHSNVALLSDADFRKVNLSDAEGKFLYDFQTYIGPRFAPDTPARAKTADPNSTNQGYFVYTPFVFHHNNEMVLVNRGWIPSEIVVGSNKLFEETPKQSIVAVFRPPYALERPSKYAMQNKLITQHPNGVKSWLYMDRDDISKSTYERMSDANGATGLDSSSWTSLAVLELISPLARDFLPTRRHPKEYTHFRVIPEHHFVYSATWFTLSASIAILTFIKYR